VFDDLQSNALLLRRLGGVLARIALVDEGDLHVLSADLLHFIRQGGDLGSFLLVGRRGRFQASTATFVRP
jgi:hypothetical protein